MKREEVNSHTPGEGDDATQPAEVVHLAAAAVLGKDVPACPEPVTEEPPPREPTLCRYCQQEIPSTASRCHHCGGDQHPIRALLRSDNLGQITALLMMLIAGWQVWLTREQLNEAKQERIAASEARAAAGEAVLAAEAAVQRAQAAEEAAHAVISDIAQIRTDVGQSSGTILRVSGMAQKALTQLDAVNQVTSKAQARLDSLDGLLSTTTIAQQAQSGSISAYLNLLKIAKGKTVSADLAKRSIAYVRGTVAAFRKVPEAWGGFTPTLQRAGRDVAVSEVSIAEVLLALSDRALDRNQRHYFMKELGKRSETELAQSAVGVLRIADGLPLDRDSIVMVAITCGLLSSKFGDKAEFLDRDGWVKFLDGHLKEETKP